MKASRFREQGEVAFILALGNFHFHVAACQQAFPGGQHMDLPGGEAESV